MLTSKNGSLKGVETLVGVAPVSPDIYNWEKRYASALERLEKDQSILEENRAKIQEFLQSREAKGLSTSRVVKYANHLIVVARLCTKKFEEMGADDVREFLYSAARRKIQCIIQSAEKENVRKLGKRVWFHLFRHTSATEFMRRKGAPAVMNKKYGWSREWDMWAVYAHMVDEDVEEAIAIGRTQKQIRQCDFKLAENRSRPKKCDRCESINDSMARFCPKCVFPLDEQVAV
ncbi:MAG: site-specific integrase [candidate division WOR-3 bacterium]